MSRSLMKRNKATGPSRIAGDLALDGELAFDVAEMARLMKAKTGAIRHRVERGQIPYRRWNGRVIFLRSEVEAFLKALPGVGVDEALRNVEASGL